MKQLTLILAVMVMISGCSSPTLSRCPEKAPEDVRQCDEHVDGEFWKCKRPDNLLRCSDAK